MALIMSRSSGTLASWAMAVRWRTVLVEHPRAMSTVRALRNAWGVRMCRGVKPDCQGHALHARLFGQPDTLGHHRRNGAVARQPHADGFGQTVHGIGRKHAGAGAAGRAGRILDLASSSSVILPAITAPTASNTEIKSISSAAGFGRVFAGQHGTAADHDGGQVQAGGRHQHAGIRFYRN